ncbi:MAG: DUF58 domain-containing protein [Firmicutes bacterium]|nr:DUF58 domain-containing protein [Bacillota bacterium]
MLSKEILKKVRKIQYKISRISNEMISGQYTSVFKGAGVEFDEVREYIPGDDIRSIDWNVTARSGVPYIKRFAEERELTVMLVIDLSGSQRFGSVESLKSELAAEIAALLAFLAIKNNDKVGLLIFTDTCEKYLPAQKGRRHVLRVIREILGYQPSGTGTKIEEALKFVNKVLKQRSIIFLVSDFMDDNFEKVMGSVARRHDLVAVRLRDPKESELPPLGLVEFQDNETGRMVLVDTSSAELRKMVRTEAEQRNENLAKLFRRNKVDLIDVQTDQPYLEPIQRFFKLREKRMR